MLMLYKLKVPVVRWFSSLCHLRVDVHLIILLPNAIYVCILFDVLMRIFHPVTDAAV